MRETQKVEGLRLSFDTSLPVLDCESSEFDQPRLVRVEHQTELIQAFPQCRQKPHPGRLPSAAQNGEIAVVTQDGEPVFMAVPMGARIDSLGVRLELAVSLFDRDQVSIGVASRIAGLSVSETIDELGRRRIPVARYSKDEFAEEMKYVRGLADRR